MQRYPHRWKSPSYALEIEPRIIEAGYPPGLARMIAFDFDRACAVFARWVDKRQNETIERDVPKNRKPKMRVPKYQNMAQVLGIEDDSAPGRADDIRASERDEIDGLVDNLRRDPAALAEFLEVK